MSKIFVKELFVLCKNWQLGFMCLKVKTVLYICIFCTFYEKRKISEKAHVRIEMGFVRRTKKNYPDTIIAFVYHPPDPRQIYPFADFIYLPEIIVKLVIRSMKILILDKYELSLICGRKVVKYANIMCFCFYIWCIHFHKTALWSWRE